MNYLVREIGSEFHLSQAGGITRNMEPSLGLDLCRDQVFVRSGREAIGVVLDHIEVTTRIAVLPSYVCTSMVDPFLQRGYDVRYFGVDRSFVPSIEDLRMALSACPDVLLVIDWFGMNTNTDVVATARELRPATLIIEDRTHSLFNGHHGLMPDFVVASLRKWLALPDGGVAASYVLRFSPPEKLDSQFPKMRREAMLLKDTYLKSGESSMKNEFRRVLLEAENDLRNTMNIHPMTEESLSLLGMLDHNGMVLQRRENYNHLRTALPRLPLKIIRNESLVDTECPFCFPILAQGFRDELKEWLAQRGVYCPVIWPLPESAYHNYQDAAYLSNSILCIPCDQRYSLGDMDYVSDMLRLFFEETQGLCQEN